VVVLLFRLPRARLRLWRCRRRRRRARWVVVLVVEEGEEEG
jgi:hypothetical protein